ncbi:MAG: hypothetical protein HYZ73_02755 [Elusimicrobia bacterium]|nr:hypothetical protein [Elusimicrobiota bacterium]
MNIAIHIAANKLGTHPFNLILRVSQMVSSLNDCWPEIDEGLVDTIRTIDNPKTAALDLPHRFE